jgi:DNA-3-methyladenine glycosylase II
MSKKLQSVRKHFHEVDPILHEVMKDMKHEELLIREKRSDYFSQLCREIIAQQLATRAAAAISTRFSALFPRGEVTPETLASLPTQMLRDVGLSWAKAGYLKDLSEKTLKKEVQFGALHTMSDELVIAELTKVKGIGRWTAEMFLIFTLGREDIFSHGDLGLRRALQKLYKLRKHPTKRRANTIVRAWAPYRSYGSLALWRVVDM